MNKEEFVNEMLALGIKLGNAKKTTKKVEILDTAERLCDEYFDAVTKVNGDEKSESTCNLQNVNVRFSSSEVRNIALELKNAALYAHSHKLTRFELQDKLNEVTKKWGLNAR